MPSLSHPSQRYKPRLTPPYFPADGSDDAAEEDWEHLPRPAYGMIPPPPSQVGMLRSGLSNCQLFVNGCAACKCSCAARCSSHQHFCDPFLLLSSSNCLCCPHPHTQPEDVEHWVAAHGLQAAPDGSSGNGSGAGPAALYGSSPMARLRALTRAALGTLPLGGGSA